MKKIIEVDENSISVMQMLNDGTLLSISPEELSDYEDPKDEVPNLYPEDGTDCWIINDYGTIYKTKFYQNVDYNIGAVDTNSAFFTRKEAEFELNRRRTIAKLKLFAENPKDEGWGRGVRHYYMYYDYLEHKIIIDFVTNGRQGKLYFESEEQAQKAIDFADEENVKKYYLGVME